MQQDRISTVKLIKYTPVQADKAKFFKTLHRLIKRGMF